MADVRLFLVRHGEAAPNIEMRYLGLRDEPLNERGARQAQQLAMAMAALPLEGVYSSPLRRASDTAAQIAGACGLALRLDVRLIEGSFGSWEGLTRGEVLARSQADAELLARWEADPHGQAPPGGESLGNVQARALALLDELRGRHAGQRLALVSHVGPIKAILCAVLGVPLASARRMFLDPATISVVDWGERPVLRLFNAHGHLGWASARWMEPDKEPGAISARQGGAAGIPAAPGA